MEISVIILNWNGLHLLKELLPLVVKHTIGDEAGVTGDGRQIAQITSLVVADNASTDGSTEWVKKEYPEVTVVRFNENYGFAEGYNRAIDLYGGRFTVLLNSDVETTPGWLVPLFEYMNSHPKCGAVQPKILSWHNRDMFEYAGAAGGFIDRNGFPYCRGRIFDTIEKDEGQYDGAPIEIAWASGAAMMVRTDVYKQVGGLDVAFFAHMEEIDLCLRMRGAGYYCAAVTQSAVYHIGGASLPQGNPKKVFLNFRNNLLLLLKNMPRKEGKRLLFRRRLIYDTMAFMVMLAKGQLSSAKAVLKAHKSFRKLRKSYDKLPEKNLLRLSPGSERNIIIDYYLKHKRK